jgi:LL-diaminopimelate aminotransferase
MARLNTNFLKLPKSYLFSTIGEKVKALKEKNNEAHLLNLGVGDIALPLAPTVVESLKEAAYEVGEHVHGYGPAEGELFLREKILESEYREHNFSPEEIFISEGIVRDICDIQDLFHPDAEVGIIDPTYPAYFNSSLLSGRIIHKIPCLEENGFIPMPPEKKLDFVYLCTPNNPTGIAMTKAHLKTWVDWAITHKTVLLVDAAYEKFITSDDVPKTIYEIEGAKQVAIEFRSFSKSAGFTGLRLGYTIIPHEAFDLNRLWRQRQDIKTNGISYPIQKAGFHSLFGLGKNECDAQVKLYSTHAKKLKEHIESLGYTVYGGENSPYIWWKIPHHNSWEFFDFLLNELHLITIPGSGFGPLGEGFVRLSSFISETTFNHTIKRLVTLGDKLCAMK